MPLQLCGSVSSMPHGAHVLLPIHLADDGGIPSTMNTKTEEPALLEFSRATRTQATASVQV